MLCVDIMPVNRFPSNHLLKYFHFLFSVSFSEGTQPACYESYIFGAKKKASGAKDISTDVG